jgi:uroporphyrinogen decarboxylase
MRKPEFKNLLRILDCERPDRPTLFEFFLNDRLYKKLSGYSIAEVENKHQINKILIPTFKNAGYDYATVWGSDFSFPTNPISLGKTISLNHYCTIYDRDSFNKYPWPNPDDFDYSLLDEINDVLPEGMKLIVYGRGGVLENVIGLVGFDNLCIMLYDNSSLVEDLFEAVGKRFVRYYEICSKFDSVGALISNDDWGFNQQTMLSPNDLRKYVFPWHKKIVEVIHASGKPAILHSCGNLDSVMDDIVDDLKYDAKHSFEDKITPVEEAYEKWGKRIAILGGIDVNFMVNSKPEEIKTRSKKMLEKSEKLGGYALGTGNSVPSYIPDENYFAMISAALES